MVTLNGPDTIEIEIDSEYIELGATAFDDRDGEIAVIVNSNLDTSTAGSYTISYVATDSAGNTGAATRTINVSEIVEPDTIAPVVTLNGDAAVTLDVGDAYIEAGATAVDVVDGVVDVSISGNVDTTTAGVYTITYTATDEAGNSASITRTVTVNEVVEPDTVPPVITLNGDAAVTLSVGDSYVEAGATAIDEVDGEVAVSISGAVDTGTAGTYTLTYSAVDAAGNASSVTRVVTVNAIIIPDTTAPVVTLLGSATVSIDVGADFTDPGATATDDRDGELAVTVTGEVDTNTAGTYTLTYSASDFAGNTGTATRTVIVNEVILPNVAPEASISSSTTAGLAPLSIEFDASASSDSDGEIVSCLLYTSDAADE